MRDCGEIEANGSSTNIVYLHGTALHVLYCRGPAVRVLYRSPYGLRNS
jgi:hypothetical protein